MRQQLDTIYLLTEWGIWQRSGQGIPRYLSPALAVIVQNVQQNGPLLCSISEEMAMTVDGVVARLMKRDREAGDAVFGYYVLGVSYAALGKIMGIPKTRAEMLHKSGVAWVDGALDRMQVAA